MNRNLFASLSGLLVAGMFAAVLLTFCAPGLGHGGTVETPDDVAMTKSLGMPPVWKGHAGFEFQWYRPGQPSSSGAAFANIGLDKDLGSPIIGLAALGIEGYFGLRDDDFDGGGRALLRLPSFYIAGGVDYGGRDEDLVFLLQLDVPIRRGGILGSGSSLALRWLPARDNTFGAGINFPLWNGNLGKTRPPSDSVALPHRSPQRLNIPTPPSELEKTLNDLGVRAGWVARLSQPFAETTGGDPHEAMAPVVDQLRAHWTATEPDFPAGHTLNAEIDAYHLDMDRAFSLALDPLGNPLSETTPAGRSASVLARRILLDDVLMPYNSLLGQRKTHDSVVGLAAVAQANFAQALLARFEPGTDEVQRAYFVFQTLCDIVEDNRRELLRRWKDSRFVWLPLQYGLLPEQHDSQAELNALVSQAANADFTEGNRAWYFVNEQFQWEIARSVWLAEDYHVLWIHDYRGRNGEGDPDEMAYLQTRNYLQALAERVRAYDRTGKLPVYMIFLDQHYFEINHGRRWLRLLSDPLDQAPGLPGKYAAWEKELVRLQEELRQAVDASDLLRVEASQFGEKWLKNRIKVHVNITNPADPSFFSRHVLGIMTVPDNNMRDHRKIAFYDISEEDPYRGVAMFTGMGIGEHYIGANWEDRTLMIQGPGALPVKDAARELLLAQGMTPEEIPAPLKALPKPPGYAAAVAAEFDSRPDWWEDRLGLMQLHNRTGFADKPINVAKAVLYSLMPAGSVLQVPDSLWQSYIYASLLSGSSLRGCRTMVIAPRADSAPSAGPPQMARAHGLMGRLIVFANGMAGPIEETGGLLAVGLYAPRQGVGDLGGRMKQAASADPSWLRRVFPDNPGIYEAALGAVDQLDSLGLAEAYLAGQGAEIQPKMHLKANFLASATAWDSLLVRPEWNAVMREYISYLGRLESKLEVGGNLPDAKAVPVDLTLRGLDLIQNFLAELTPSQRESLVYYCSVGSVNMDYRSMCLDGEAMVLLSGWQSLEGIMDFLLLAGLCEWIETTEELDTLLPPPSGMVRRLAGFMKLIL